MTLIETPQPTPEQIPLQRMDTPADLGVDPFIAHDEYMLNRKGALLLDKVGEEKLKDIQDSVRDWVEQSGVLENQSEYYGKYDRAFIEIKMNGLISHLAEKFDGLIHPLEYETSKQFVSTAFDLYEDESDKSPEYEGSFAFVVPVRMSRNNVEYGEEAEPISPLFRYIPNELKAQFLVGMPPFIIDRYEVDSNGKRGYVIWGAVSQDIIDDLEPLDALVTGQKNVNNAIDFAQKKLGVKVVGLGATLPGVMNLGRDVTNDDVIVTTGHGGTVRLIEETIVAAKERGYVQADKEKIGVLGLGAIGSSIARLISRRFPESQVVIYDTDPAKIQRTGASLAAQESDYEVAESDVNLITSADIVVSAVTNKIHLKKSGLNELNGKFLIDDSEPACFDPDEVTSLNGRMTKVIGEDAAGTTAVREDYDYGTMLDAKKDLFGCEAEAASLASYYDELIERGMPEKLAARIVRKVAITGPVSPQGARLIGALFKKYSIEPATFQAFRVKTLPPVE